jgi:hypothetical protein
MAELLGLPNETLLHIFHYLPQSVKHPKPQADLLNLIVTCKQIAPLALEVLFCAPILESSKIREFLRILFKYEDLQDTIKTLTIETGDALHGDRFERTYTRPSTRQEASIGLHRSCPLAMDHVRRLLYKVRLDR